MLARFSQWLWGGRGDAPLQTPAEAQWNAARDAYFTRLQGLGVPLDGAAPIDADGTVRAQCDALQRRVTQQIAALEPMRAAPRAALTAAWQEWHAGVLQKFCDAARAFRCAEPAATYATVAKAAITGQPLPRGVYPPIILTLHNAVPAYAVDLHVRKRGMPGPASSTVRVKPVSAVTLAAAPRSELRTALAAALMASGVDAVTTTTPVYITPAAHAALLASAQRVADRRGAAVPPDDPADAVTLGVLRASHERCTRGGGGGAGGVVPVPTSATAATPPRVGADKGAAAPPCVDTRAMSASLP